jgi:hypothetical protein
MNARTFKVYRCQCGKRTVNIDKVCINCYMRRHRSRLRLRQKHERKKLPRIEDNFCLNLKENQSKMKVCKLCGWPISDNSSIDLPVSSQL